jgi:hypothetical protein
MEGVFSCGHRPLENYDNGVVCDRIIDGKCVECPIGPKLKTVVGRDLFPRTRPSDPTRSRVGSDRLMIGRVASCRGKFATIAHLLTNHISFLSRYLLLSFRDPRPQAKGTQIF